MYAGGPKVADTTTSPASVKVHGFVVPRQGPSVQPTKVEPESAFADKVMVVLAGKETGAHKAEQFRMLSAERKLPVCPASPKTFSPTWTMGVVVLKAAVTIMEELSATTQVVPAAHPPPPIQPPKVEDGAGVAVKATLGGLAGSVRGYWPVHIPA
jgi:hypothetical protein